MQFNRSKITIFSIVGLLFVLATCKNDDYDVIPNVPVNLTLSPNEVLMMGNNTVLLKEGGVHGIIVYRVSETEFEAFDRCCSYYPNDDVAVDVNSSNLATCPNCKSEFQIMLEGQVIKGPAKYPLKKYNAYYDGSRVTISK